jgi:CBS domain-containing protein
VKKTSELVQDKGTEVWSVGRDETVLEALTFMTRHNIGAVLVMDAGQLVGILSERDFSRKSAELRQDVLQMPVHEVMTARPVCVGPENTVEECMALMTSKRVRHLPVLEGDRVVGLVSIGDVVKATIAEQQYIIEQLEHYIGG